MFDLLGGKFELRIWLAILLIVVTTTLTLIGDQATFVHPAKTTFERVLTLLPVLIYSWVENRVTCFALTVACYGGTVGVISYATVTFLERKVFEPLFFRRMIQTKLREERLFNQYMNRFKS